MSVGGNFVDNVVIVGGGTAGWMTAAALSHKFGTSGAQITLIESEEIGTVGVGEATLPHIRFFNAAMGIDEAELMARTQATFKLGIEFAGWGKPGESYIHPFGDYGEPHDGIAFHHLWTQQRLAGNHKRLCEYSLPVMMAEANRYTMPDPDPAALLSTFGYAFQFDASLYAAYLSQLSQGRGVKRVEGKITHANRNGENGRIDSVVLENGTVIDGDLFIDCSGFRGLLIEQTLATGYEDWSHYLPCNRAFAVQCEPSDPIGPYTRATARKAGWQWRIPLQHRIGNGHVYCSDYISDDEARSILLDNLEGAPITEPRQLFFKTGRRNKLWNGNVVAIGLAGGFLEPLESTSIHLIQQGITALVEMFPTDASMDADAEEYNAMMQLEFDRIRDFLVLHYVANQREGEKFWDDMRAMEWPASLKEKVTAFVQSGIIPRYDVGAFLPPSWLAVFVGQNILPQGYDPRLDRFDANQIAREVENLRSRIAGTVDGLPVHMDFVRGHCPGNISPAL
ncbi:tryptophan halogenase family protein [Sphingorhabdus arenilitoris]|uniref:Tryptophan halogenase family protein n=1 Tax=Sphingorhabdus arenilitoris TaxID=1490041 RepID=A0ABV8RK19_9SPHN